METVTVVATSQHGLSMPMLAMLALAALLVAAVGWHLIARTRV
ncbi:MAG TPA: hypothetical protein VLW26_03770 [Steroidobacteraceae bacterium]|nr:hypothetical protein [Steroidobacteraceae bacterium]